MPAALPAYVRQVAPHDVLRWLGAGWRDFARAPLVGCVHGLVLVLGALAIVAIGRRHYGLLVGAFSGFALVAPSLVLGLYDTSRRLASGTPATLSSSLAAWRSAGLKPLAFGFTLALAGTLWVVVSTAIVGAPAGSASLPAHSAAAGGASLADGGAETFLRYFLTADHGFRFTAWLLSGGLLASVVFAASAVSIPLMLDRDVQMRQAVLISVAAVGANPLTMATWAATIMALTLIGLASVVGALFVLPWLGHASWHAYLELVDAGALPLRRRRPH